jgi:hypothetical protein
LRCFLVGRSKGNPEESRRNPDTHELVGRSQDSRGIQTPTNSSVGATDQRVRSRRLEAV